MPQPFAAGAEPLCLRQLLAAEQEFEALVVGSGATGGVAAMVLAEAGMRVLVLEAGPALTARQAFSGEPLNLLRRVANLAGGRQRLQANHPGYWKHNPELYVDERRHPYATPADAPFLWTRGRQLGGRSLTWGGITLRLSDHEFRAAERDGHGRAWPIGLADLAPYYSRLERLFGVHGQADGLPQLPDGDYRPPLPFTPAEQHLKARIEQQLGLPLIHSRGFRLHRPHPSQSWPRSSSPGVTLARAGASGRLLLCCDAVVSHLQMAPAGGRAEGVVVVEADRGGQHLLRADLVVLCASTLETLRILLHSSAAVRAGGLADPSGSLGTGLMDHVSCARFFSLPAMAEPAEPQELSGAGSCFIPNTLNLNGEEGLGFRRGYGLWAAVQRFDPPRFLKRRPQEALGFLIGHGEVLANPANRIRLDLSRADVHGLPLPHITCRWGANEQAMVHHMQERMAAVVAAASGELLPLPELVKLPLLEPWLRRSPALAAAAAPPGYYVHELGGAPMAERPEDGVLNAWNQCWGAPNVLVSDGACWPSAGWQSPTLTSMALTWRACEAAAGRLRGGALGVHG
ncbi:MAG: GMC family oxidoreductase [Synechococcaceae cyanobacterium]|jgi:choline dehydrogenase-like flavoprotein|nr:GMC family oxidoreductase [Synechococcaceae cyanobacterium]